MTGIWGIVNATPDSFSDGGRYLDPQRAIDHGLQLRRDGADVLDVGGESTRPGSRRISVAEEQSRVLDVIAALAAEGIPVSVDTLNASTALAAVGAGARIVNDVSGGLADPEMLAAVAGTGADYVISHWRGPSDDMYARAEYSRPSREVAAELQERFTAAAAAGIAPARIILDPGLGFAKDGMQNWEVLRGIGDVVALGSRVLIGTSRKGFLRETLAAGSVREEKSPGEDRMPPQASSRSDFSSAGAQGAGAGAQGAGADTRVAASDDVDEARRDLATAVTSALAARAGAWAVRVHNVAATRDALAVVRAWDG